MHRILVTGGTGTLGRRLVPRLLARGHEVVVSSRQPGRRDDGAAEVRLDLATADGLATAVAGVDTIVHAATDAARVKRVDLEGTAALLAASSEAGVGHLVYPSIVGIDDHAFAYYRAKKAVEEMIERSGVPYTILRTTQFHQFPARIADAQRRLPIVLAPSGVAFQVLDADVAAARLAELIEAGPSGRASDLGGAEPLQVRDLIRQYMRARGSRRPVVGLRVPGAAGRDFRAGLQLSDDHSGASPTWEDFLSGVGTARSGVPT